MTVIGFDNAGKSFGYRRILSGITFGVNRGQRVALVGANGVGKTTLLRILMGEETADEGGVWMADGETIASVPQHPVFSGTATLGSELECLPRDYPIKKALKRFGFKEADLAQPVHTMSGGQKTRLALMRVWAANPSILILDEPTNHLDTGALDWLESFVRGFRGTVLMVSHDRYFLDKVTNRVVEVTPTAAHTYEGNYTDYRNRKEEARRHHAKAWEEQEKRTAVLREAIERQLKWFHVAHRDSTKDNSVKMGAKEYKRAMAARLCKRAKSNIKRLERMIDRGVEKPKADVTVSLSLTDAGKTGRRLLEAKGLAKGYEPNGPLFANSDFTVLRGDRVALVGPNASGKTTLIRLLLGTEAPDAGSVWLSDSIRIGYMDQEMSSLRPEATALEMALEATGRTDREAGIRTRNLMGSLLFRNDDVDKPVGVLSHGERMRLCLVRLLLSDYNLLVLDEPTNHLDLPTRERLEEALMDYRGTLIVVSHDRYLLDKVATKTLSIENGAISTYLGGYSYFLEERARRLGEGREAAVRDERRRQRDEYLILSNRLAVVCSELGRIPKDSAGFAEKESEFLELSRLIRSGQGGAP